MEPLVEPEDVAGVIRWAASPGPAERAVHQAVTDHLVLTVRLGGPGPGDRGWRSRHDELVASFLSSADPEQPDVVRLRRVEHERQQRWVDRQGPVRKELFATLLPMLAEPPEVPVDAAAHLEPLCWLVERVGEGMRITKTGTFARAVVQEVADRYGWVLSDKPPQNETHVFQVTLLRELARRLGLVRRQGTTLSVTTAGKVLAADPEALWDRMVERALELPAFDHFSGETWLAMQLVSGPVEYPQTHELVARAAAEQGWRSGGRPPSPHDCSDGINELAWTLRLLELFGGERRGLAVPERLNEAGRAAALAILRDQSLRP